MNNGFHQRTAALIGSAGLKRLAASWVAVIGLGGVGSFALEALARSGIGRLTIVDHDIVELHNTNRQLLAIRSNLGRLKTEAAAERIYNIDPGIKVEGISARYHSDNHDTIICKEMSYVIDAIDEVEAKIALITACVNDNIPVISSMGTARRLNPAKLLLDDISNTKNCTLARKVRKGLRKAGVEKGVEVLYSIEEPVSADTTALGSMVFVPGSAGLLLAARVIEILLNKDKKREA